MSFVTCKLVGRMGNQMFEIAAAAALALDNGVKYYRSKTCGDHIYFPWIEPLPDDAQILFTHFEKGHEYKPIPYHPNMMIDGYFQTEKYFAHHRQYILNLFGMNNSHIKEGHCAVFVRRGDFLALPKIFPPVTLQYVLDAMDYIFSHSGIKKFTIFSDGIEWCKENIIRPEYEISFNNELPFHIEMKYMSSFEHMIMSNSTFSWWSAWANENPNKIIVAPKIWFGPASRLNTKDVCPESWVRL